ncbi:GSCOCG00011209001-RA-CDS [Cotesia congregata]|nr:GSCOCG00011209001-RA-CDS [Cotesia congregata]
MISVPRFFLVNRQLLFATMLFYLFVILFASALVQAAPTELTITDLKGVIEEVTTLRPSTVNETVYLDAKASQALGSPLESAEITSTTFNSVEDDGVSALTLEFTTEAQVFSTATTPITDDIISTWTRETTTESLIDSTTSIKSYCNARNN